MSIRDKRHPGLAPAPADADADAPDHRPMGEKKLEHFSESEVEKRIQAGIKRKECKTRLQQRPKRS